MFVGSKFWKSTRKIRVISVSSYKGKKKFVQMPEVSDSDSDFESYQCVDTIDAGDAGEASHMNKVVDRMDAIEKAMKLSISQIESVDQLKKNISARITAQKSGTLTGHLKSPYRASQISRKLSVDGDTMLSYNTMHGLRR